MPSFADYLAAYGQDPENPISPVPGPGEASPGAVLRGAALTLFPGYDRDVINPAIGSAFTPPKTAREYATELSRDKTNIDPLSMVMGVAGGEPATFIGPGARTWNAAAAAQAEKMLAAGASRREIEQATGTSFNAAMQPQQEISDAGTRFIPPTPPKTSGDFVLDARGRFVNPKLITPEYKAGDIMPGWAGFEAYPEMADWPVKFSHPEFNAPGQIVAGALDQSTNPPTLLLNLRAKDTDPRSTFLHEMGGHGVSRIEDFPAGGGFNTPEVVARADRTLTERRDAYMQTIQDVSNRSGAWAMERAGGDPAKAAGFVNQYFEIHPDDAQLMQNALIEKAKYNRGRMSLEERFKAYQQLAGENDARNIEKRMDMTPEQLAQTSREETQDVPFSDQLLRFNTGLPPLKRPTQTPQGPAQGELPFSRDLPSFTERMAQAQDIAQERRNRGFSTGDYGLGTARRTAPDAPKGSFEDFAARQRAGFQADKANILNAYRESVGLPRAGNEAPILAPGETSLEFSAKPLPEGYDFLTGRRPDAPYPQFAEEYPATRRPTYLPAEKGGTYPAKTLTKEAQQFADTRDKIIEEMRTEGYQPFFDPSQRFPAQFEKQPGPHVDTAQALAAKQETIDRHLAEIDAPETRAALRQAYAKGLDLPDSQAWYHLGQVEKKMVQDLGEEAGRAEFRNGLATAMSSTTTGMTPQQNLIMAQYLNYLKATGRPLPTASYQTPVTVGGQRTMPNVKAYEEMMLQGGYPALSLENPKRADFAQALMGNPNAFTVDEQMSHGMIGKDVPQKGTYGIVTRIGREEAGKIGEDPARYQDVSWAGFKKMLEEQSREKKGFRPYGPGEGYQGKPMISEINDMIERTHRLTGMPRQEIWTRGFLKHEIPLYGIGGLTLGGVLASQMQQAEQP